MSEFALPLVVAAGTVLLALSLGLVLARRRRRRVRSLLEGQMGLKPVSSRARLGRTAWFEGSAEGRTYVAGLINLSGPDASGQGRRYRQSLCLVMGVHLGSQVQSISHRGRFTRDHLDRFEGTFKYRKSAMPPNGNVRQALMNFADVHGRVNLWTRQRGQLILRSKIFSDSSHVLIWLGPSYPAPDQIEAAAGGLTRVAVEIEDE